MTSRSDTAQGTHRRSFLLLHLAVIPTVVRLMTQLLPPFERLPDGSTGKTGPIHNLAVIGRRGHAITGFVHEDTALDALLQIVIVETIALIAYVAAAWEDGAFRC